MTKSIYEELREERKELQHKGLLPDWFTTNGYQMFKEKYLWEVYSFKDQVHRIASTAARHTDDPKAWEEKFFQVIWRGWLACATPVLANMGTKRGLPVSCSSTYVEDSIYSFYNKQVEIAQLSKHGFGTACYLGDIRARGSNVATGGNASGVLPVFKDYVQLSRDVSQANIRRGAWAGYLEIDHPDFWELLTFIQNNPDDANVGWIITDKFIKRLEKGDPDAISRYQKSLKVKCVTGKGYYWFVDKVNRLAPKYWKEKGLKNVASNLCVAPETLILTSEGYKQISLLQDKEVKVWNGEEFSNTIVQKTGERQSLIKISTKDGYELECTPYHKFYVLEETLSGKRTKPPRYKEVRASDLEIGSKLMKFDLPIIEGKEELHKAYTNGFYSGDGCSAPQGSRIYLYHEKRELKNHIEHDKNWTIQDNFDREYCHVKGLENKFFVPSTDYTIETRLKWLAGLLDSDGTVCVNDKSQSLQIGSINKEFLQETQLMLQTLGCTSKVTKNKEAGKRLMPKNDGSGDLDWFDCQANYRLLINGNSLYTLTKLGLTCHRLKWEERKPNRSCDQYIQVSDLEEVVELKDTYCFTEPLRNKGMFNGLLTGNCSEISLPSTPDLSFTCVLSSLNLSKYDEWKDTDTIFVSTVFLDCVAQEFIDLGKEIKGLECTVDFTEKSRALGLGTLGFHTYLQSHNIPFESLEAHFKNLEIYKNIYEESLKASQWMAKQWGECEWTEGTGLRGIARTAIAPNSSSALICGSVSQGIEPIYKNVYTQSSAAGEMHRINPVLLKLMKEKGVFNEDTLESVIKDKGSIRNQDWLNDHEKLVFKTAFEIDQKIIVRLASLRQQYICQAQSLNLFFAADEDEEYISEVHKQAFLDPNIKSLYYLRSLAGVYASKDECLSCEG